MYHTDPRQLQMKMLISGSFASIRSHLYASHTGLNTCLPHNMRRFCLLTRSLLYFPLQPRMAPTAQQRIQRFLHNCRPGDPELATSCRFRMACCTGQTVTGWQLSWRTRARQSALVHGGLAPSPRKGATPTRKVLSYSFLADARICFPIGKIRTHAILCRLLSLLSCCAGSLLILPPLPECLSHLLHNMYSHI